MYFLQDEYQQTHAEDLAFHRLTSVLKSAGGWMVGERFNDQFNTEVGGFHRIYKQWIDPNGQFQGGAALTADGKPEFVQATSKIIDYFADGKCYTMDEAAKVPELAEVLVRLKEREAVYIAFLAHREKESKRFADRRDLLAREYAKRRVRFLPGHVIRLLYTQAGLN
jgi:hypothetical protein